MAHTRKLASGRIQGRYYDLDGNRRSAGSFSTKRDALRAAREREVEQERTIQAPAPTLRTTLDEYARTFLRAIEGEVTIDTVKNHERCLRLHILPTFGTRRLGSIKRSEVTIWHHGLATPAIRRAAYGTLSRIMRMAMDDDLIEKTPCRVRGAMRHEESHGAAYSVQDAQAVIEALPEPYRLIAVVQFGAALRASEVLGLDWDLIDLATGEIQVRQQAYKGAVVQRTKTGRTRSAWLLTSALDALRAHRRARPSIGSSPVFVGPEGRRISYTRYQQAIAVARAEAGVDGFTSHALRHAALAAYHRHHGNLVETMQRGGHVDYRSALVYQRQAAGRPAALADFEAKMHA